MEPTVEVTVRLYNWLRDAAGCAQDSLAVPTGTTLREMVTGPLVDRYPAVRSAVVLGDGTMSPHLAFFRNGTLLTQRDLDVVVESGDEIKIFPALSGG